MQMTVEDPRMGLPSSASPLGITDNDAKCIVDRYPTFFTGKDTSPGSVRNEYVKTG